MANEEHLKLILDDVNNWNEWKFFQETSFVADFENADLSHALLQNVDLIWANLRSANCFLSDFTSGDLSFADLVSTDFESADLTRVQLEEADLRNANLTNASFKRANLSCADLRGAIMQGADFEHAHMGAVDISTQIENAGPINQGEVCSYSDLSLVKNLTQTQLEDCVGDSGTILPDHLKRPSGWIVLPGHLNGKKMDVTLQIALRDLEKKRSSLTRDSNQKQAQQNTTPEKPFVFISYKREDQPWVQTLRAHLVANDLGVWWDQDIPSDARWADEIGKHLDLAAAVIVVWTEKSVLSREVAAEAHFGRSKDKLVQIKHGNPTLGYQYAPLQCANLTDWNPGQPHADFDRLLQTLRRRLA